MTSHQHLLHFSCLFLALFFGSCVSSSKYKNEYKNHQEARLQLAQLDQIKNERDSLKKELDLSQLTLLKTEKTLTEFYIKYKSQEHSTNGTEPSDPSSSQQKLKLLNDTLSDLKLTISSKNKELIDLKSKHKIQEEKYQDQDKRISDLFSALYKQRTAYDSLQAEYYALHKSKNQNSASNKIDPEENKKLKKALSSKDSENFLQQKKIEENNFKISTLQNKLDSISSANEKLLAQNQEPKRDPDLDKSNADYYQLQSEYNALKKENELALKESKEKEREIENFKTENTKLKEQLKEIDNTKAQIIALESENTKLKDRLKENKTGKTQLSSLETENTKLKEQLKDGENSKAQISVLESENAKLKVQLNEAENRKTQLIVLESENTKFKKDQKSLQFKIDSLIQLQNKKIEKEVKPKENKTESISNRKIDSLQNLLAQKELSISEKEREIKSIKSELQQNQTNKEKQSSTEPKPILTPNKTALLEKLKKIPGTEINFQDKTGNITIDLPQSQLFTTDLITLTQKGSELIIKIAQTMAGSNFQAVEVSAIQDATKARNDQIELMFGRAKALGKLMNIYGVKSDNFSFGLQPTGDKENIRISLSLK